MNERFEQIRAIWSEEIGGRTVYRDVAFLIGEVDRLQAEIDYLRNDLVTAHGYANVDWFGAGRSDDDTAAIQAAIDAVASQADIDKERGR